MHIKATTHSQFKAITRTVTHMQYKCNHTHTNSQKHTPSHTHVKAITHSHIKATTNTYWHIHTYKSNYTFTYKSNLTHPCAFTHFKRGGAISPLSGEHLKLVEKFMYLGSCVSSCCSLTKRLRLIDNQNRGRKWNGNFYNIYKIQYSPAVWKIKPLQLVDYLIRILTSPDNRV